MQSHLCDLQLACRVTWPIVNKLVYNFFIFYIFNHASIVNVSNVWPLLTYTTWRIADHLVSWLSNYKSCLIEYWIVLLMLKFCSKNFVWQIIDLYHLFWHFIQSISSHRILTFTTYFEILFKEFCLTNYWLLPLILIFYPINLVSLNIDFYYLFWNFLVWPIIGLNYSF